MEEKKEQEKQEPKGKIVTISDLVGMIYDIMGRDCWVILSLEGNPKEKMITTTIVNIVAQDVILPQIQTPNPNRPEYSG